MNDFSYNPIGNYQNIFDQNLREVNNNTKLLEGGIEKFQIDPNLISSDKELQNDLNELNAATQTDKTCDSFADALKKSLDEVTELDKQANATKETFLAGGDIDVHTVMIASQKANLSLQMAMQVRNKAIQAYNEIFRMSV